MDENLFSVFDISSRGMSVQRQRLSATARNIANANTTKGADGKPFQREVVAVRDTYKSNFPNQLKNSLQLERTAESHIQSVFNNNPKSQDVNILAYTAKDTSPPRIIYDPTHPDASEDGYVSMPNVNIVTEMVEMISAQRSFEANASVIESVKNMARDSMEI